MPDKEEYERLLPALQLLVSELDENQKRSLFRLALDPEKTIVAGSALFYGMTARMNSLETIAKNLDGSSPMGADAQYHFRESIEQFVRAWKGLVKK